MHPTMSSPSAPDTDSSQVDGGSAATVTPQPEIAVSDPQKRRPNTLLIFASSLAAVLLLGVGVVIGSAIGSSSDESTPDSKPPFAAAKQKCAAYSPHAKLGDGGRSLTISGEGEERDGLPYTAVACILREVDTPDAVIAQMDSSGRTIPTTVYR